MIKNLVVPFKAKLMMLGAIVYLISPIDLIPDLLIGPGLLDDALVVPGLILFAIAALITWLAWAALILYVGGLIMAERQTRVSYGELIRTTGFAAAPGLLQVFAMFTAIAVPVFVVSWVWMLAAMTVAVRQALDFRSTWHAIGVCLVTFCVVMTTTIGVMLALQATVS